MNPHQPPVDPLKKAVDERRNDKAFMDRLRKNMKKHAKLLRLLKESGD